METRNHRLVLPADANHYGTLYAGALLRIALESAYTTAFRLVPEDASLVLRRVLDLQCYRPVPVGKVIEIRGVALHAHAAYLVVGLLGTPIAAEDQPWMDGLFGFVRVEDGRPIALPDDVAGKVVGSEDWQPLKSRMEQLLAIR